MTTPTIIINSTITIVTTMMTSMVVAPSLWGILVGCGVLLLTGTAVDSSLWGTLVGCGMLLGEAVPVAWEVDSSGVCGGVIVGETAEMKHGTSQNNIL